MKKAIKWLAVIMAVLCAVSIFVACGKDEEEDKELQNIESRIESAVHDNVYKRVILSYEIQGSPKITTYVRETGDNTYKVTGQITGKDEYGRSFSGTYEATATYDDETDKCKVTSVDIGTLRIQ